MKINLPHVPYKFIYLCILLILPALSFPSEKVIYGEDDRIEPFDSPFAELARSTAAKISNRSLIKEGNRFQIKGSNLIERFNICPDERFTEQLVAASCSGFLVAPDVLLTAGHCMTSEDFDCKKFSWVFDFSLSLGMDNITSVNKDNVYSCIKILASDYDPLNDFFENDYAVIQLDRPVANRTPLPVRKSGEVEIGTPLLIIGHPSGLPTKIAAGAFVRDDPSFLYFDATLDSFGGNSGSAVINQENGVVEGILVQGETDYTLDGQDSCYRPKKCAYDECVGERVIRTTMVPYLRKLDNQ